MALHLSHLTHRTRHLAPSHPVPCNCPGAPFLVSFQLASSFIVHSSSMTTMKLDGSNEVRLGHLWPSFVSKFNTLGCQTFNPRLQRGKALESIWISVCSSPLSIASTCCKMGNMPSFHICDIILQLLLQPPGLMRSPSKHCSLLCRSSLISQRLMRHILFGASNYSIAETIKLFSPQEYPSEQVYVSHAVYGKHHTGLSLFLFKPLQ